MKKPFIGNIVHYTHRTSGDVCAALVTKVNDDGTVSACVFYESSQRHKVGIEQTSSVAGSDDAKGKWCWPA